MRQFNFKLIIAAISSLAIISSTFAGDSHQVSGGLRRRIGTENETKTSLISQRMLVRL
jgi:hypothetical protein